MDYQKLILEKLLTKYEQSMHYRGENDSNRRVLLKLGPKSKDLKEYDIEDFEKKELIHSIVFDLKQKNLINFEWEAFNKGNIMASVWLNLDYMEAACLLIDKPPKWQIVKLILDIITELRHELTVIQDNQIGNLHLPWILIALQDMQTGIKKKKQLNPYLPESIEHAKQVLTAIRELCMSSENELLERVFSLRCYGDTKFFEHNIRNRLINFIKKYGLMGYDSDFDISDEEILRSVGISKNPEIIEFCGPINVEINGYNINFQPMSYGSALNSDTLKIITGIDMKKINKVMFVENRSNFSQYINSDLIEHELVIYHGGFYTPIRRKFFQMIYQSAQPLAQFYHWGDIDLGGFSIFLRLKKEIIPQLKPFRMDAETLKAKKQYASNISIDYRKKIEKALHDPKFEQFHDCIIHMLELGIRLEQEVFYI